jgi:FkbM family methyltransferase
LLIKNEEMNLFEYIRYKSNKKAYKLKQEAKRFAWLSDYRFCSILDIGSNEGQFAEKILSIFPNAEIHCFEPLPEIYDALKLNLHSQNKAYFYNYALGTSTGEVSMQRNEYSPSSSLLEMLDLHKINFDFAVKSKSTKIQIRTLDSFFKNPIKGPVLLKIDVQGYEMPVLRGGNSVLEQSSVVIIETSFYQLYKDQPLFEDIYSYLTNRGFRYVGNVEQLESPKNRQILQADAVFIKK